ncbi:MAG: DUF2442 domain-containing protein [Oscillospiraceae bacterium]|jgi:hypothetical protein|nr:DUF2442 domain-containing protein [Oscillospiraceae bacterium]
MRPRAVSVMPLENYILEIAFSNGERKFFDVKPYLNYPAFKNIKNIFYTVRIDGLSVAWQDGTDICPDELYYESKQKGTQND